LLRYITITNHYLLQSRASDAKEKYEDTRFFAVQALNMSMDAYQAALQLYTDAQSLQIPAVNTQHLTNEANSIKEKVRILYFKFTLY